VGQLFRIIIPTLAIIWSDPNACLLFDEFKATLLYKNAIDLSNQRKCRVVFPVAGACSCFCPADMIVQVAIPTLLTTSHRFPKSENSNNNSFPGIYLTEIGHIGLLLCLDGHKSKYTDLSKTPK
jgi:hypothetical protein